MSIQHTYSNNLVESIVSTKTGLAVVTVEGDETDLLLTVGERGGKKVTLRLTFDQATTFFNSMNISATRLVRNMQRKGAR